jgi:hypothetical protein
VSSGSQFEHAVGIARDGLKALLLFNLGAAGALVALTDKTNNAHDYTFAILFFGAGSFFALITYLVGYMSQLSYANHCLETEKRNDKDAKMELDRHKRFQNLAFGFIFVTLLLSLLGIGAAFLAARS